MRSRDELIQEFEDWTKKYVEADKHLKSLLPHISKLSKGERLQPLIVTDQRLVDAKEAEEAVGTALAMMRDILDQL